ncbi:MAG: GNAT family N-acetyltransferase [Phycisphaerales bacterium]
MLDHSTVARLEEGRQATDLAEIAPESRRFAGGCAGRGTPGSWINNAVGIGLGGEIDPADIEALARWYQENSIEPRVEICPYAHPSAMLACERAGFVLRNWENVLYRPLDRSSTARSVVEPPAALVIREIDKSDAGLVREYSRVSMSGFFPPGVTPGESDYELSGRWARHPRAVCVAGLIDGAVVGAGSLSMSAAGDVGSLAGLSVLPEYRRRGIQQALIAFRLNAAAERGARLATIGSRPGAATERNVRRMGFQLAYTKAVIVRPGAGLVPQAG